MNPSDNDSFPEVPGSCCGPDSSQAAVPPQAVGVCQPPVAAAPVSAAKPSILRRMLKSLLITLFIISVVLNLYLLIILGASLQRPLKEQQYLAGDETQKIAMIDLTETIDMDTAEQFRRSLHLAADDENVKGVIVVVNSPGGQVAPSAMIAEYIRGFIAKQKALAKQSDAGRASKQAKKIYAAIQQVGAAANEEELRQKANSPANG